MLEFDATPHAETCAELDDLAARLDDRIMARRWTGRLRRTLEAEAIGASTQMEGVPVTVSDVQRILAGDRPAAVTEEDGALVEGYAAAMTYAQRRADDGALAWTPELLIGLHDRIVAGRPDHGAGRLRDGAAWVAGPDGSVVFAPPDAERLSTLVATLCHTAETADWHPAVASAWLHVGLAAVHPFRDGNGRTARVIASLAMYREDSAIRRSPAWRSGGVVTRRSTTRRSPASGSDSMRRPTSRRSSPLTSKRNSSRPSPSPCVSGPRASSGPRSRTCSRTVTFRRAWPTRSTTRSSDATSPRGTTPTSPRPASQPRETT